jgi:hypothetical protein
MGDWQPMHPLAPLGTHGELRSDGMKEKKSRTPWENKLGRGRERVIMNTKAFNLTT